MTKATECRKVYNIIFAGGSIPPMTASLISVTNGYETYVYTDRGRSFNGIELVDNFHNMGFDVSKTQSVDDEKSFNAAVNTVKQIKAKDKDAYFYFYTGESRGLKCAAIASNAGLTKDDFHIFMIEDGIDSYKKFAVNYGENAACEEVYQAVYNKAFSLTKRKWFSRKTAEKVVGILKNMEKNNGPAGKYMEKLGQQRFEKSLKKAEKYFEKITSRTDNRYDNSIFAADYRWPFALAALENFTYMLQDKEKIYSIVKGTNNSFMLRFFDVENNGENCCAHMEYKNLAQRIMQLSDEQKKKYLGLMFGRYGEEVNNVFFRKNREDLQAPAEKLVYVNARFDTMFARPVTNKVYGLGGISEEKTVSSYSSLDGKYKSPFLFEKEEDWEILADALDMLDSCSQAPQNVIRQAKAKVFNMYADYIFTAKLIYKLYGDRYDIIVKNHPRTDIGTSSEWANYKIYYNGENCVDYGAALDKALMDFHKKDSVGRYIGLVNGSISTECFEYIDAQVSFAGQPSSVYNGLSDSADIPFIIVDTDMDITGGDSAHVAYSAVSGRYISGKMKFKDTDGKIKDTVFYNTGNTLKACSRAADDESLAGFYDSLYANWLERKYPQAKDIDSQGFAVLE